MRATRRQLHGATMRVRRRWKRRLCVLNAVRIPCASISTMRGANCASQATERCAFSPALVLTRITPTTTQDAIDALERLAVYPSRAALVARPDPHALQQGSSLRMRQRAAYDDPLMVGVLKMGSGGWNLQLGAHAASTTLQRISDLHSAQSLAIVQARRHLRPSNVGEMRVSSARHPPHERPETSPPPFTQLDSPSIITPLSTTPPSRRAPPSRAEPTDFNMG
ncbi:hypothetical protein HYPSUDRAFT_909173 [Hypholoma sublateritium FD-334 SS-4]|uniref:Uncharacterized protein n=1 Tax=Hypholoma sublateritium (strain FD-334 SS-4) TaxID=945553 RepID=A0A0D2NQF2_HYPSF|nr:hypothetical protein HYPSUDRAFT_909173 [Hypholoma sublateritium FD-334 SS-4]